MWDRQDVGVKCTARILPFIALSIPSQDDRNQTTELHTESKCLFTTSQLCLKAPASSQGDPAQGERRHSSPGDSKRSEPAWKAPSPKLALHRAGRGRGIGRRRERPARSGEAGPGARTQGPDLGGLVTSSPLAPTCYGAGGNPAKPRTFRVMLCCLVLQPPCTLSLLGTRTRW